MTERTGRDAAGSFAARFAPIAAAIGFLLFGRTEEGFAQTLRQAPNSRIAMEMPESFTPSDRFSGFIDEKSGASFVIMEMPGAAYDELKAIGDQADALAQKGVVETRKVELAGRSGDHVYITGKQKTPAGDYGKYIFIMREADLTAMITANVPLEAIDGKSVTPAQIERAFQTATVKAEALKGAELFSLSYLGPFKETITVLGSSKAYSLSGKLPEAGAAKPNVDPIFVVSPSADKRPVLDVKTTAQSSFRSIGGLSAHEVKSEKDVVIAGLKGYEISGEGQDRTGARTGLYVVMLVVEGGGYYVMAGSAAAADMPVYLPEFQKIALGFEPKTPQ